MMGGWINLHRKITESEIYPKGRPFTKYEAWLDLLIIAAHSSKNVMIGNDVIKCDRGQIIRSVESYQKHWNWTRQQVRCFFDMLERDNMITRITTNKTTILTICNYGIYQDKQPTKNKQEEEEINNQRYNQQTTNKTAMLNGCTSVLYKDEQPTKNQQNNQRYNHKQEYKEIKNIERGKFTPPTLSEIQDYFAERIAAKRVNMNPINEAEKFESFYSSKGWMVGKNKMTNWQKAVTGWISRSKSNIGQVSNIAPAKTTEISNFLN